MDGETSPVAAKTILDFEKPTKQHILNCSYSKWHSMYKKIAPRSKVIPLSPEFISYLRADGIVLPHDDITPQYNNDDDSGVFSESTENNDDDDDEEGESEDPSLQFQPVHNAIKETIHELGGKVTPKLNWSAPKDATFILNNSLECRTPSEIYLLLKSSDFITHDLKYAFDDTQDDNDNNTSCETIQYDLILRKWVNFITSVEFRCFVKDRTLIGVTQRDLNHYDFLEQQQDELLDLIIDFFELHLQDTFPDPNFVFDVYIPSTTTRSPRVWLIDINAYSLTTDPLTFSWTQLMNIDPSASGFEPEMRLVKKDDPEAYGFYGGQALGRGGQYGAYKMPKEVVEAGADGPGGIAEFAERWKEIIAKMDNADLSDSSEEEGDEDQYEDDDDDDDEDEEEPEKSKEKNELASESGPKADSSSNG